jgi:hypothetical protein
LYISLLKSNYQGINKINPQDRFKKLKSVLGGTRENEIEDSAFIGTYIHKIQNPTEIIS